MIEIKNIHKKFGDLTVLNDISTVFASGRVNMIIGASGTGKSVLLKNIVGLIKPDSGEILYHGRNLIGADRDTTRQIRREIGMLFQGSALFDSLTVEQNVQFPLDLLSKMTKAEKKERVAFCLERVNLSHARTKMPSEISGGMKKRVGIARAIVMNSQYLLCDEPNSGLDPLTSIVIDNLILEITKEFNLTTIVVSHDMNSVIELGEHIMFLHSGINCWEGSNKEITNSDNKFLNDFIFANNLMTHFRK